MRTTGARLGTVARKLTASASAPPSAAGSPARTVTS